MKRANGTGSVYKVKNGWKAIITLYYDENGSRKTRSRIYKTKKEALAGLNDLQGRTDYDSMTFAEAWGKITLDVSRSKTYEYKKAWERLKPIHGTQVALARTALLQSAIDAIPTYYAKHAAKVVLGHIYKFATANDIVTHSPMRYIKLPKKPAPPKQVFSEEEINKLWFYSDKEEARWLLIMIYCGLRTGELREMKTENINLKERYMIGGLKTDQGRNRIIPIPEKLIPIIEQQTGKTLADVCINTFYKRYGEFLAEIGIPFRHARFCRHTFASRAAEKGIPPAVIQEIMGHTDYNTSLIYTHISTAKKVEYIDKI